MTKWVVAVTTAPRKEPTLHTCLDSLKGCGWSPIVFAEPDSLKSDCQTINNPKRLGVWHNWLSAAKYCLNNTDADTIMTVQDDTLFHPDSKRFAEKILWPSSNVGFVSLYTSKAYSMQGDFLRQRGVNQIACPILWGACCLIFPRKVLSDIVEHPIAKKWLGVINSVNEAAFHLHTEHPELIADDDTAIARIVNNMRRTMWFVDPSPVEHIGKESTINYGTNSGNRNCLRLADRSISLFDQVPFSNSYEVE